MRSESAACPVRGTSSAILRTLLTKRFPSTKPVPAVSVRLCSAAPLAALATSISSSSPRSCCASACRCTLDPRNCAPKAVAPPIKAPIGLARGPTIGSTGGVTAAPKRAPPNAVPITPACPANARGTCPTPETAADNTPSSSAISFMRWKDGASP